MPGRPVPTLEPAVRPEAATGMGPTTPMVVQPPSRKLTLRMIQIGLGLIWIVAGALQYQPFMFSKGFLSQVIAPVAQGQPAGIGSSINWSVSVMSHHLVLYNAVFATVQVLIGFGLLFKRSVRPALAASFVWVLGVWWFGEGLGSVLTGTASPLTGAPGAVLLYGLIGALAWPVGSTEESQGPAAAPDGGVRVGGWAAPAGRLAWAGLWLSAAALWLQPANRAGGAFHDQLQSAAYGWLGSLQHTVATMSEGHGTGIATGLAVVSVLVGLGVLHPTTNRAALTVGIILSVGYWAFGQGFGALTSGTATDVNAGPLFVLLALRLWIDPVNVRWFAPSHPITDGARPRLRIMGHTLGNS